ELTVAINGLWIGDGSPEGKKDAEQAIEKLIKSGVKVDFGTDFKPSDDKLQKLNNAAQDVREVLEKMKTDGHKPTETFEQMLDKRMAAPEAKTTNQQSPDTKPNGSVQRPPWAAS